MTDLIITEKPSVCRKFKYYLLGKNANQKSYGKNVNYYSGEKNGKKIIITPLRGHVYTISYPNDSWKYPDIIPKEDLVLEKNKGCHNYIKAIEKILKENDIQTIYSAGDVDIEGSALIGNVLRKKCGMKQNYTPKGDYNYKRLYFSALTKREITNAYKNPNEYDTDRTRAGFTRSVIDIEVGFNITRALTHAVRNAGGRVKVVSSGRVQGPTLGILYDKEKNIENFESNPFWRLKAKLNVNNDDLTLTYFDDNKDENEDRIWSKEELEKIKKECEKENKVDLEVEKEIENDYPYPPFNLTSLQKTANKAFNFSPSKTKKIAEYLYNSGYCSYPRTSSNKWPKGYFNKKYMKNKLKEIKKYDYLKEDAKQALNNFRWAPIQGNNLDTAHPPLHIVKSPKEKLSEDKHKIFILIAKGFMGSFCSNAKIEKTTLYTKINNHEFKETGNIVKEKGYREVYPWAKKVKSKIPKVNSGKYSLSELFTKKSKTKPPRRYSQTRLIGEMENQNLGTKETRDNIVNKLRKRKYYTGKKSIELTPRGKVIGKTLKKYVPKLVSSDFTSQFHKDLKKIEEGEKDYSKIISTYLEEFEEIFKEFKEKESKIGENIVKKLDIDTTTGEECPECEDGELIKRSGKNGTFLGCTNYPDCNHTEPVEKDKKIQNKTCPECENDLVFRTGKYGKFLACSNSDCDFTKSISN
ncbi:MAG: DNA topoisomerase I [archaeon]